MEETIQNTSTGVVARNEIRSVADVTERYRTPGPHATAVLALTVPGQQGDDRHTRWHAMRTDLRHQGADDDVLTHLDHLIDALEPRPRHVLMTANPAGAAYCWLGGHSRPSTTHVGVHPALVPALAEFEGSAPVISAVVDRLGADLYELDHLDIEPISTVDGAEEVLEREVRPSSRAQRGPGGDEAGHQRRVEAALDRTGAAVAAEIARLAAERGTSLVVVTGDDRAAAAVEHHLSPHRFEVRRVHAGGRHEPDTDERLHQASLVEVARHRDRRVAGAVERLERELGLQDRAVAGQVETLEAIAEGRVETVFFDAGSIEQMGDADSIAKEALVMGGNVIVAPSLPSHDGVAALLRFGYR